MAQIIPVIDIRGQQVVLADCGQREQYHPLQSSRLADSANPVQALAGILTLHPFQTVYIADLDAIEGTGDNAAVIANMRASQPRTLFWLDAGVDAKGRLPAHALLPGICPVIGTENALSAQQRHSTLKRHPQAILSLDLNGTDDCLPWAESQNLWPPNIILMCLDRIGSDAGPDLARLRDLAQQLGERHILHAAGGIRNAADLAKLDLCGIQGALIATALHKGWIAP